MIACYTVRPATALLSLTMHDEDESPLQFPCEFPIKAMGQSNCDLEAVVTDIVRKHAPDLEEDAVYSRTSAQGNYTSVTVVVNATSREQLDAIYQDLVDCKTVIMAL